MNYVATWNFFINVFVNLCIYVSTSANVLFFSSKFKLLFSSVKSIFNIKVEKSSRILKRDKNKKTNFAEHLFSYREIRTQPFACMIRQESHQINSSRKFKNPSVFLVLVADEISSIFNPRLLDGISSDVRSQFRCLLWKPPRDIFCTFLTRELCFWFSTVSFWFKCFNCSLQI